PSDLPEPLTRRDRPARHDPQLAAAGLAERSPPAVDGDAARPQPQVEVEAGQALLGAREHRGAALEPLARGAVVDPYPVALHVIALVAVTGEVGVATIAGSWRRGRFDTRRGHRGGGGQQAEHDRDYGGAGRPARGRPAPGRAARERGGMAAEFRHRSSVTGARDSRVSARPGGPGGRGQCEGSSPVSRPWRSALEGLRPVISTVVPRRSYLVVIASSA